MRTTLPPPPRPADLGPGAQWLAGEGAGSWFTLRINPDAPEIFHMERRSPNGQLECRGLFLRDPLSEGFDPLLHYTITYPSHCARITLLQNGQLFALLPFPEELLP